LADSTYKIQSEYTFDIDYNGPPFILAEESGIAEQPVHVSALEMEADKIAGYYWDFDDGFKSGSRETIWKYSRPGDYKVKLGLEQQKKANGIIPRSCISKKIKIYDDYQQLAAYNFNKSFHQPVQKIIPSGPELNSFRIMNYYIGKFEGIRYANINASLDSISEFALGFDDENNLLPKTLALLDFYIAILNSNPDIRLEIAVHQNNKASEKNNKEVTGLLASNIYDYLQKRIINNNRVICTGYGDSRPLQDWKEPDSQIVNKRIEFIFINNNPPSIK
jgi:outer membrane protein OmpA-like peptidoglycan-associated protein